ncbi:MAG: flavin reductase family protein [Candidatus Hermodarchaeota archaeon]
MTLKRIKRFPYLLPKPVAIVGALVDNKPNFLTIADISTTGYQIPRFVVSSGKSHYTNKGIIENETFSVNIPSSKMVAETDFVGIRSGISTDKSKVFDVFFGEELKSAPLIKNAPIVHACKLVKTVDFGDTHYLFIGEIIETYVDEDILTKKIPDIERANPFVFHNDGFYWKVGEKLAQAYKVGKSLEEE